MYTRVFSGILRSSIMDTSVETRWLFITMLIIGDESGDGIVEMTMSRLAAHAGLTLEQTEKALGELMNPDPDSASKEHDGRRIIPLIPEKPDRDWMIVNWGKYKAIAKEESRREQWRKDSAAYRERQQELVRMRQSGSGDSQVGVRIASAPTESESKAETKTEKSTTPPTPRRRGGNGSDEEFERFWEEYPKKVGKGAALQAWVRLSKAERALAIENAAVFAECWRGAPEENLQYQVGPAPWLNQKRWTDDPKQWRLMAFRDHPEELSRASREADADKLRKEHDRVKAIMNGGD